MIWALAARLPVLVARAVDPVANVRALRDGVRLLRTHAVLILAMTREELVSRHSGQLLGSAWILIHPLALTFLYLFLFGVVFAQRIGGTREMPLDYTAYILSGLIPWFTFQVAMTTSVVAVSGNANLAKQFVFPLEILPVRDAVSACLTWLVGVSATLLYVMASQRLAFGTWLLLPVVLAWQLLAMIGVALVLSALAVFVRDLRDVIGLFSMVAIFLMPVVYLPGWVPPLFQPVMLANPFTYMVWVYQDVIYFGRVAHPIGWVVFGLGAPLVFAWGVRVFRATKPAFSSVL